MCLLCFPYAAGAREIQSQYEFFAHARLARQVGEVDLPEGIKPEIPE